MRQSLVRAKQTGEDSGRTEEQRRTDGQMRARFMGYRWELWVTDGRSGGGRGSKRAAKRMYVVVVDGQGGYGIGQENQRVDPQWEAGRLINNGTRRGRRGTRQ